MLWEHLERHLTQTVRLLQGSGITGGLTYERNQDVYLGPEKPAGTQGTALEGGGGGTCLGGDRSAGGAMES